jgi:hypothetical protein
MRAIASGCVLARQTSRPLRVHWYRTHNCNARFDALFAASARFEVVERWAMAPIVRTAIFGYEKWWRRLGGAVVARDDATLSRFDVAMATRAKDIYIRSYAKFFDEPGMFDVFEPAARIQRAVDELRPRLDRAIGVHIRRTDNQQSIAKSPLSAFISRMEDAIAEDDAAAFFVATDSRETYRELAQRFGKRVFEHHKATLARDDPAGIVDAVVDLYALGGCQRIIGSYWSSFTDTAAELRNIPCIIAKSDETR